MASSSIQRPFSSVLFRQHLTAKCIGHCLHHFEKTTSTMDEALVLMQTADHGTLIVADCQTKGVGRGDGRVWSSPAYENIYTTLILHPNSLHDAIRINLGIGVAVANAIRSCGVANAGVKWPNDVWVDGKKVAGVLANNNVRSDQKLVMMVGIGINVNVNMSLNPNPDVAHSAISIRSILQKDVEREVLLAKLCSEIERMLCQNSEEMLSEYKKLHVLDGQKIVVMPRKLEHRDDHYEAICLGVAPTGELRIQVSGHEKLLSAEEVSIRPRVDAWLQTQQ